jgi:hypothetical protein
MPFSKNFPKSSDKTVYPKWEEVYLEEHEEHEAEEKAAKQNIDLMRECIHDAKAIIKDEELKPYQTDLINIAIALFEKRASHEIYHKENKAKEKFDEKR